MVQDAGYCCLIASFDSYGICYGAQNKEVSILLEFKSRDWIPSPHQPEGQCGIGYIDRDMLLKSNNAVNVANHLNCLNEQNPCEYNTDG
jgi:hypothetical protein